MLRSGKEQPAASELLWRLATKEIRGFAQQTAEFLPKKGSASSRLYFPTGVAYIFPTDFIHIDKICYNMQNIT